MTTNAAGQTTEPLGTASDPLNVTVSGGSLDTSSLATAANQATELIDLGGVTETAPGTDTASSGLNGRLQRVAQRLTSIIALLPTALASNGGLKVELASGIAPVNDGIAIGARAGIGATPFKNLDIDESEDDISTSACTLYSLILTNLATTTRYVKLYNATAANTTVGSTTPTWTIAVPAGAGFVYSSSVGTAFSTALCIASTTAVGDADSGAPGTNDVVASGSYK